MKFRNKIACLMVLAMIQMPCVSFAAEEDKELSLIAAEQERSEEDERLGEINPALTDAISTERTQETDKEKKERKKKLKQTRKEKEKSNEQKLKDSTNEKLDKRKDDNHKEDSLIIIEPTEPTKPAKPAKIEQPRPEQRPITENTTPTPPKQPIIEPSTPIPPTQSIIEPSTPIPPTQSIIESSTPVETADLPDQKIVYANFTETARAVKFIPLYMSRKSGYEITGLYANQGIVEIHYGRRWEPTVSLTLKTYKRKDGEEPQDISGVKGVKWRVDTTTGTTIYIAKISETRHVAAWAVGHYTFSAQAENLSYAGFHSLVADELVELSTHYYLDL